MSTSTGPESDPAPPSDPRSGWHLPPPGEMPRVARLDELVTRVLAPNPSPMTLDGTNTYVVMAPGAGEAAIVDPGPLDAAHLGRVEGLLAERDAQCRWIVLTHGHLDHAEAAPDWGTRLGAQLAAAAPSVAGRAGVVVAAGERLPVATTTLQVVATAGHTLDHVALRLENDAVLVGDHVLGRGTSVVAHPEGSLLAYAESLRRLLRLGPAVLYPGHGPELREDPSAVLYYYLEHRRFREAQVRRVLALAEAPVPVSELVRRIYPEVDPGLRAAAEQSTRAALEKLRVEGAVRRAPDGTRWLPAS